MQYPTKIFIDGPAWIGDMVMAQSLFKLLKQRYPEATIDVLAPAWTQPVLARMPEVNRIWAAPFAHGELNLKQRYRLAKKLRAEQYDWALILRNSLKSALIPYWAKIPRRTGWLGEMRLILLNDWRKLVKTDYPLMIERFMALALAPQQPLPIPYPRPQLLASPDQIQMTWQQLMLTAPQAPILVLCPGAEYGSAKRWPTEYFAEVAKAKLAEHWQVWLLGSQQEQVLTQQINQYCAGQCVDFAGRTSLTQAIDLLACATMVVCNDSGLMHIAAALERPLVVLYGSSSAAFTPPLATRVSMLTLNLACSPCFQRECPLQHRHCLTQLSPTMVLQAMHKLAIN